MVQKPMPMKAKIVPPRKFSQTKEKSRDSDYSPVWSSAILVAIGRFSTENCQHEKTLTAPAIGQTRTARNENL